MKQKLASLLFAFLCGTVNIYAQTPTIIPDKPEDQFELSNYYITHNQPNEAKIKKRFLHSIS